MNREDGEDEREQCKNIMKKNTMKKNTVKKNEGEDANGGEECVVDTRRRRRGELYAIRVLNLIG